MEVEKIVEQTLVEPDTVIMEQAVSMADMLVSNYGLWFLAGVLILTFRKLIENTVAGIMFFFCSDLELDDIIFICGRKARIIRLGLRKAVFYMDDTQTKMIVPNIQLKELTIEKKLVKESEYKPKE
jgi:hypothetical protein